MVMAFWRNIRRLTKAFILFIISNSYSKIIEFNLVECRKIIWLAWERKTTEKTDFILLLSKKNDYNGPHLQGSLKLTSIRLYIYSMSLQTICNGSIAAFIFCIIYNNIYNNSKAKLKVNRKLRNINKFYCKLSSCLKNAVIWKFKKNHFAAFEQIFRDLSVFLWLRSA